MTMMNSKVHKLSTEESTSPEYSDEAKICLCAGVNLWTKYENDPKMKIHTTSFQSVEIL